MAVFDPRNPLPYGGTYTADASEAADPLINTLAIQEAADAAHQAFLTEGSEQKLLLDDHFPVTAARRGDNPDVEQEGWINQYRTRYTLVHRSGVNIEGAGGLKYLVPPVAINAGLNNFTAIVTADLRLSNTPLSQMEVTRRTSIRGITIDTTALTWEELRAMGEGSICGAIAVGKGDEFTVEDVNITSGWGFTGAITVHTGSRSGRLTGSHISMIRKYNTPPGNAIWCDGATNLLIQGNHIHDCEIGISLASNHDNDLHPTGNVIRGNIIDQFHGTGIALHASDSVVSENDITNITGRFIVVTSSAASAHHPGFPSQGLLITRNRLTTTYPLVTNQAYGVHLMGSNYSRYIVVAGNEMNHMYYMVCVDNPFAVANVIWKNYSVLRPCQNLTNDASGANVYVENTL